MSAPVRFAPKERLTSDANCPATMDEPPTWKKSSSALTVRASTPSVSAQALTTAVSTGVSGAPPPRALFCPFHSVSSACASHEPSPLRGITSTAITSLGSRKPGRHRAAYDVTFAASTLAGVTAPMITLLPVVSTTAALSSTPGALERAAATRAVASSLVAALLRPLRAVAARSASNVTSSSDMPSAISATSSALAIWLRLTFPVASLGMLSTNTKHCGHLEGGRRCAACWQSWRRPGSWIPRVGTTTTPTVSCNVACGTEMATTSDTPGWLWSASSISAGEMISPPRLITSLLLPVTYKYPSASIQPMSPVLNQFPSGLIKNDSAVARGSFSYPPVTMSPLTTMCATRPAATRSPASSTMATSGQMGCPLLPARSSAYPGGGHVMGMHSVMP